MERSETWLRAVWRHCADCGVFVCVAPTDGEVLCHSCWLNAHAASEAAPGFAYEHMAPSRFAHMRKRGAAQ